VIAVVLWLALGGVFYIFYLNPLAGPTVFVIDGLQRTSPLIVCPGDTINFQFNVEAKEIGTYNLYMSTWKANPPSTIIFSEIQPFVISSLRSFTITRKWLVPQTYIDPATNEEISITPGDYTRDVSVTAVGRNTNNKPLQVMFTVKKGCPK
jgi:hypothetical protein